MKVYYCKYLFPLENDSEVFAYKKTCKFTLNIYRNN